MHTLEVMDMLILKKAAWTFHTLWDTWEGWTCVRRAKVSWNQLEIAVAFIFSTFLEAESICWAPVSG